MWDILSLTSVLRGNMMRIREKLLFNIVKQVYRNEKMPNYERILEKMNFSLSFIMLVILIIRTYFYEINRAVCIQIVGFCLAFITIDTIIFNHCEYENLEKCYKDGNIFSNITHGLYYIVKRINGIVESIVVLTFLVHIVLLIVLHNIDLDFFYIYIMEICIALSVRGLLIDYIVILCESYFISGRKIMFYKDISNIKIIKTTVSPSEELVWTEIKYRDRVAYDKFFRSDFISIKRKVEEVGTYGVSIL